MKLLTFTEAAAFVGVSVKTIHKHVKSGKIESIDSPFGRRIAEDALIPYREFIGTKGNTQDLLSAPKRELSSPGETGQEQSGASQGKHADQNVPLEAHLAALAFAERRITETQAQVDRERERATLAERMQLALEMTLRQHKTVLEEQAESLTQERARRLQFEARLECPPETSVPEVRVDLEEENRKLQEQFEADRAELRKRLKLAESRVDWLEKRVPRWVRSIFRAG